MLENALIEHDSQSTSNLKGDLNMKRILVFAYGLICYAAFLGTFLYLAAFLGNLLPVGAMDSPATTPLWQALLIDALLVGVFGLQHSIMARQKFKEWWTRFVAEPMERSTYV